MSTDSLVPPFPRTADAGLVMAPSPLKCGLLIAGVKLALRAVGFKRTMAWISGRAEREPVLGEVAPETIKATEYAVAMAGAFYPGRAMCLEQSLTLYYCLRCQGVAVQFRIGVQPYPFAAHAWVEYEGQPINDVEEHVKWFTPLPDLRA